MEEKEVYKTNGVLILALLAIYLFLFYRHEKQVVELLIAALFLSSIQLLYFKLAYYIAFGWMQLGKGLGYINSKILLSIVFLVVVVPIGILKRKKKSATSSNWLQSDVKEVDFRKLG